MKNGKILVVEDDKKIAEVLKEYLEEEDFVVEVLNSGDKVVSTVQDSPPDLLLLDIRLPNKDGIMICREIRSFSDVPIIFVTAKVDDIDRLLGLEIGADDYICKPFVTREVVARVKAVIRRTHPKHTENKLVVESLVMDLKAHKVTVNGCKVDLTPIEYNLLRIMMSNPDQVFTRADLISKTQGYDADCYERTIDNHIKNLRKKISLQSPDQEIIHTVFGVGYKIGSL